MEEGGEDQPKQPERLSNAYPVPVTVQKLRNSAAEAELRGDWADAALMVSAADRLLALEAQNQAYRHALQAGVSINMVAKRRWVHNWRNN